MPAPTNISWPTALSLGGILPISTTQEQSFGGTTYNTYYTLVVPAGVTEIGVFLYGNFGTWNPSASIWRDPLGTPVQINGSISGTSVPEQVLVISGETIGIISSKQVGNPSPALTTISVIVGPTVPLAVGQIFSNDISANYPGIRVNPLIGAVSSFTPIAFSYGNYGRFLTSGKSLYSDDLLNSCVLYDNKQVSILTVTGLEVGNEFVIGTDQTTGFWVSKRVGGVTHALAQFVNSSGIASVPTYDMGANSAGMKSLTPSLDNTILYFLQSTALVNKPMQKIILGTLVVSNFIAGAADKIWAPGMMTMLDGTILAGISTLVGITFTENFVRRYDSSAVLLNTYNIGADWRVSYIFAAIDDPISFWVYAQPTVVFPNPVFAFNRYINIRVSDGAFLTDFQVPQFIDGVSQQPGSISSIRFGSSYGGALGIIRGVSNAASGLYTVSGTGAGAGNPLIRHDQNWIDTSLGTNENVKIPNPRYDTYLAGDE